MLLQAHGMVKRWDDSDTVPPHFVAPVQGAGVPPNDVLVQLLIVEQPT